MLHNSKMPIARRSMGPHSLVSDIKEADMTGETPSRRSPSRLSRRAAIGSMLAAPMIARGARAQAPLTVPWGEDDVAPRT